MMTFNNLILIFTCIVFFGCNTINNNIDEEVLYTGYVLERETDKPLAGVQVYLTRTAGITTPTVLQQTTTDKNGQYQFNLEKFKYENGQYSIGMKTYEYDLSDYRFRSYGYLQIDGKMYQCLYGSLGVTQIRQDKPPITVRLHLDSYFKVHIKNTNAISPQDSFRMHRYHEPTLVLLGTDVDTVVYEHRGFSECRGILGQAFKYYDPTYRGHRNYYDDYCCDNGDTCLIEIFY